MIVFAIAPTINPTYAFENFVIYDSMIARKGTEENETRGESCVRVCARVCIYMCARARVLGRAIPLLNFFSDIYKYYKYKRIHTRVKVDRR